MQYIIIQIKPFTGEVSPKYRVSDRKTMKSTSEVAFEIPQGMTPEQRFKQVLGWVGDHRLHGLTPLEESEE